MPTPTNKDRDEKHRRRRELRNGVSRPDGRELAEALYGGLDEREPDQPDPSGKDDGTTNN